MRTFKVLRIKRPEILDESFSSRSICGRYAEPAPGEQEDKKKEKVCLDIDLLVFDDRILRPEDLKREYVRKGLEELK